MARVSAARVEADRLLFQGQWYPIAKHLTFFAAEPDQWVSTFLDDGDRSEWRAEELFRARPVAGDLEQLFGELLPIQSVGTGRILVVPVNTDGPYRTAIFGNGLVGSDFGGIQLSLARRGMGSATVWSWPDNMRGQVWPVQEHGRHQLCVMRPTARQPDGATWETRVIDLRRGHRDWVFEEDGRPLPFEDTARYLQERDRDKFDQLLLIDYAAALGLRCFDPASYAPGRTGVLIQYLSYRGGNNRLFTVAEAQSGGRYDQIGIPDSYRLRTAPGNL